MVTCASSGLKKHEDDAEGMAAYIAKPHKVRLDNPEMPPQDYVSEETRLAAAKYLLTVTK